MAALISMVRSVCPDADLFVPKMAYAGRLRGSVCLTAPEKLAAALLDDLDQIILQRESGGEAYGEIILLGYSMGAMIVRKVALLAHGETDSAPFEKSLEAYRDGKTWATRITRIVLLAGLSKGWSLNSASSRLATFGWWLGSALGDLLTNGRLTILEMRSGTPFVVQTRLQWLALADRSDPPSLDVVQLLGTIDDVVGPDDMVDLAVDLRPGSNFALLEMPRTGHFDAPDVADPRTARGTAAERWRLLEAALTLPMNALLTHPATVDARLLADGTVPVPDPEVTDVAFVIHGIRDKGFWTQKIARAIKREGERSSTDGKSRIIRSMTMSYGYLAMAPFVLWWVRRRKTAWLMDRYTESRALYPKADFSFVGHSNGTYLAARALADYPAARFRRIVFAGSVVRSDYDWRSPARRPAPQVCALLNYVATSDLVVAIFPNGFSFSRLVDLGGAGHTGFRQFGHPDASEGKPTVLKGDFTSEPSYEVHFVAGGHSAGIRESQWDDIARFVVRGERPRAGDEDYLGAQRPVARFLGSFPPMSLLMALLVVVAIGAGISWLAGGWGLAAYLGILILVATRL
ncbi:MAG TPA: hypothetical protein VF704_08950 [Allosphingosinicella sp.]|jgi:pimeloyl-ACP methyl ester carboxylesterase